MINTPSEDDSRCIIYESNAISTDTQFSICLHDCRRVDSMTDLQSKVAMSNYFDQIVLRFLSVSLELTGFACAVTSNTFARAIMIDQTTSYLDRKQKKEVHSMCSSSSGSFVTCLCRSLVDHPRRLVVQRHLLCVVVVVVVTADVAQANRLPMLSVAFPAFSLPLTLNKQSTSMAKSLANASSVR